MAEAKDKPTRERALAFWEALTGLECHEHAASQNSPHAMTHLMAVLGFGEVPSRSDIEETYQEWRSQHPNDAHREGVARRDGVLDYLQGVVDALRPEGHGTCKTCAEWGEKGNAGRGLCHSGRWQSEDVWFDDSDCPHPLTQPTFFCAFWHPKGGVTP